MHCHFYVIDCDILMFCWRFLFHEGYWIIILHFWKWPFSGVGIRVMLGSGMTMDNDPYSPFFWKCFVYAWCSCLFVFFFSFLECLMEFISKAIWAWNFPLGKMLINLISLIGIGPIRFYFSFLTFGKMYFSITISSKMLNFGIKVSHILYYPFNVYTISSDILFPFLILVVCFWSGLRKVC